MSPIFWPHFACLYLGISSSCPKKRVFSVCSGSVDSPPSSCVVNPSLNSSMSASCSFKSTLNDPSDESSVTARCRWPTDKRFSSLNVTRLWSNDLKKKLQFEINYKNMNEISQHFWIQMPDWFCFQIQWGSEIQIWNAWKGVVCKWPSNGIWYLEAWLFEIWTNRHFVKNHLISRQKCPDFKWPGFKMAGTIALYLRINANPVNFVSFNTG